MFKASDFVARDSLPFWNGTLGFGLMAEVVSPREQVTACLLELITTFGGSMQPGEELFTLCVSIGSSFEPALAHPKTRANEVVMAMLNSGNLKLQSITSINELCAVLELLIVTIPKGKKVLLLLDRLDDLFGACLVDAAGTETRYGGERKAPEKEYCSDQRVNLGRRSVRPSDMMLSEDPNFAGGSGIPLALDKFRVLLSSHHVAAIWVRSSYTQAMVFGGAQTETRDADKEAGILWSTSLRQGAFPKPSPFADAFKKLAPTVINYGGPQ